MRNLRTFKRLRSVFRTYMSRPRMRRVTRRRIGTLAGTQKEYVAHKESARVLVHAKLQMLNAQYGFVYKKVAIRNQRTRWGSCSIKGNLNFHYKLIYLPERLVDYIIVHELCHLAEFNHSPKFWGMVARTLPNHRVLRAELRRVNIQKNIRQPNAVTDIAG